MRKVIAGAIGALALSLGMASVASAGQWAAGARNTFQVAAHTSWATEASATSAPEIDPAGALSGLTLLLGGLAIVRGRRFRK